jgi:hypothetical protein
MADVKISGLPASTTPLAGTEVLPVVQSGVTKKVASDDLTVKNIRSNATTGILQVTGPAAAATRVMTTPDANFTAARTDAAQSFTGDQTLSTGNLVIGTSGKGIDFSATAGTGTSELLADYEEGTWTPADNSGAELVFTDVAGHYTKIGRCVTAAFTVTYPVTVSVSNARISLPFTAVTGDNNTGFYTTFTNSSQTFSGITIGTFLQFYDNGSNIKTNANFSSFIIRGVVVYYV